VAERLTEAKIWSLDLVHLKGFGFLLCACRGCGQLFRDKLRVFDPRNRTVDVNVDDGPTCEHDGIEIKVAESGISALACDTVAARKLDTLRIWAHDVGINLDYEISPHSRIRLCLPSPATTARRGLNPSNTAQWRRRPYIPNFRPTISVGASAGFFGRLTSKAANNRSSRQNFSMTAFG
jgi:hypothetical protein